jgi:hypothetical protein
MTADRDGRLVESACVYRVHDRSGRNSVGAICEYKPLAEGIIDIETWGDVGS